MEHMSKFIFPWIQINLDQFVFSVLCYSKVLVLLITFLIAFKLTVRTTTRLEDIKRKIIDHYDGSIKDVTMCIGGYSKDQIVDPKKRLCDVGVTTAGSYLLVYDFVPVSYPLLTTAVPDVQQKLPIWNKNRS